MLTRVQPQSPLKDLAQLTSLLLLPHLLDTPLTTGQVAPVEQLLDFSFACELPLLNHLRCEVGSLLFDPPFNLKQLSSRPFLLLIQQMTHTEYLLPQRCGLRPPLRRCHHLLHQPLCVLHTFTQLVHMSLMVMLQLLVKLEGGFEDEATVEVGEVVVQVSGVDVQLGQVLFEQ